MKATGDVGAYLADLEHPLEQVILLLRKAILAADKRIEESIKWNAPSYHVAGAHFATFHLRRSDRVQLVLHLGAKPRPGATVRESVPDPEGLLEWKGADRAIITVSDAADASTKRSAITGIVRVWVQQL